MRILAIDLSWTGVSGWVFWSDEIDDPFIVYGSFRPPTKAKTTFEIASAIVDSIEEIFVTVPGNIDVLVYEKTDWHRTLSRFTGKRFAVEYKIERQTQRTLGKAEVAIALACRQYIGKGVGKLIDIGANEAKIEFGAMRKDACASLLAEQYPDRFERHDKRESFLYDKLLGCDIPHHVSDAMVIASVVAARERQNEMVISAGAV